MQSNGRSRAYSLYELVMTLGLFAVLVTVAVPSFGRIVASHRLRTEVDRLFHGIHHARKESVVRRRVMTICPTTDGVLCGSMADWSAGWMMYINIDRDWPAVRDEDEPVVKWVRVQEGVRITANRRSFSLRSTELRATNGTLVFCDHKKRARSRALVISYTGRPRVAYEDTRGQPYDCPD
jgi:type IV fimbrial biogenesis protein FimT